MDTKTKIAIVGGAFLIGSFIPLWRSGENRGQNLWQFLHHHSVFSKSDAMWIKKEQLEAIQNGVKG